MKIISLIFPIFLILYIRAEFFITNAINGTPPDENTELPKMVVFTEPSFEVYCTFCPIFGYCLPVRQLGHIKTIFSNRKVIDMKELDEFGRKCTTLSCPSDMIFYNSKCVHIGTKRDKYRQIRCPEYDEKVPHKFTYTLNYKNLHATLYVQKRCIPKDMFCVMQSFENGITLTICDDQTMKVGSRQTRNVTVIVTLGKDGTLDDLVVEGVGTGMNNKRNRQDGVQFAIIVHSKESPNKLTIWGVERPPQEFFDKTLRQLDDELIVLSRIPIAMPNGLQAEIREEVKASSADPYEIHRRKWRLLIYDPVSLEMNRFSNFGRNSLASGHSSNLYEWYLRGNDNLGFPTFTANVNTDEM
uniref:Uncharacterized protein n=1 Tax=Acrobeloides nanus TaxID=290746 RepID=A0A914DMU9_9BILA